MREDMFEVIVECRRRGSRGGNRGAAKLARAFEDSAAPLTGRRAAKLRGHSRSLNENLNPLKRYLASQVGRPWNKIYSEICASLDTGSSVKQHVRDHAVDFVAMPYLRPDGTLAASSEQFRVCGTPWYEALYVDPRDGLLKESRTLWRKLGIDLRPRRARQTEDADTVWLAEDALLRRLDGIWYRLVLGPETTPEEGRPVLSKRQLGRKALAVHGLENAR